MNAGTENFGKSLEEQRLDDWSSVLKSEDVSGMSDNEIIKLPALNSGCPYGKLNNMQLLYQRLAIPLNQ